MKVATHITPLTPKELYDRFLQGERPKYVHDVDADKPMKELELLANKYRQSLAFEDKKNLIRQEREVLYEEIGKPELTLARNYDDIKMMIPQNCELAQKYAAEMIDAMNIEGVVRIEEAINNGFVYDIDKNKVQSLKNAFDKLGDDDLSIMLKEKLGCAASYIFNKYSENLDENDNNLLNTIYYGQEFEEEVDADLIDNYTFDSNRSAEEFKIAFLSLPTEVTKDIAPVIETVLSSDKFDALSKRYAAWGAGKFKSDNNFEIIKRIALDTDEKDIRLREFAIHSTALYLRQKPEEVRSIMKQISSDKSIFEPLGKVLNDKVNGNYLGNMNTDFKYFKTPTEDIVRLSQFVNKKIFIDSNLNVSQNRDMYRNLLQYTNVIKRREQLFPKIYIMKDTYTRIAPNEAGKRSFYPKSFLNSGYFMDTLTGVYSGDVIMINKKYMGKAYSTLAHEMGHALNDMFDYDDTKKLKTLYDKSIKGGYSLSEYSKSNEREYFAMGCQAMSEIYIPHAELLHDAATTRYKLLDSDPKLFNFVKHCLQKY